MVKSLPINSAKVIAVMMLDTVEDAVPVAEALLEGGVKILEITLRTQAALGAISAISKALPEATVGAGTIIEPHQFQEAKNAGAQFFVSPGLTPALALSARATELPYLPGVTTASEVIHAHELGYDMLKFFPAEIAGGVRALKAFAPLFPNMKFCPTGGVNPDNMHDYLALDNVFCVGGSWLTPSALIKNKDWAGITALAKKVS